MNKQDIINVCAEKTQYTKKESEAFVEAMLDAIVEALAAGEHVIFRDFGKFSVKERKARIGRNPKSPETTYELPPHKAVVFSAGQRLKDVVNK